ncbi:NACHT domain-containing protein [Oscillatoria sp. FACHB-1407]|uniref:NACHT domain-containing protein n=1 Tax=Oscillatoria sp. FACHB-1407 TaxID=2692847 RepID=UPI001688D2FE|nr:NACHT domain-containing protein [Oscillatoria sp. FACHB-1407]
MSYLQDIWNSLSQVVQSHPWLAPMGAIALTLLTLGRKFITTVAQRVLIKLDAKLDQKADEIADWLVGQLEQLLQQGWGLVFSGFQQRYYKSLVYLLRDYRVQGLKTRGPFVLDLRKVFVPLRVAPESADNITAAMLQPRKVKQGLDIWDFLGANIPSLRRLVILGPPGSGKTTLLEHLTLTYAQHFSRRYHRRTPRLVPVLLYLRDVRGAIITENPPMLAALIEQQASIQALNPPPHWFQTRLKQGKCLVLLDGLDEVADTQQRQQVSHWVAQQIRTYPENRFILTSRPFGYKTAPLEEVSTLEVQPFNLKQMQQFIRSWYLQTEMMSRLGRDDPGVRAIATQQANDLISRIQRNSPLVAMAVNPLLLTMIATIHRYRGALPGRRVELYSEICDVLLGRRQEAKNLPPDSLTAIQKKSVLQVLALNRMRKQVREFTLLQASLLIQEKLTAVTGETLYPDVFLQQIENVSGLIVEKQPGVYEFAHKSFQEYLASVQIKEMNQEFVLIRNIDEPWWEETIRLYAAQGDATYLIQTALNRDAIASLTLAYECLEEALSVHPTVRQHLETTLEQGLESLHPDRFKLAVEVKLNRRLRQLLPIDEHTEIDRDYITCAEYQLFIDESRKAGETRQPRHWETDRFAPGAAHKPIIGVGLNDAEEFCNWLTQRSNNLGDTYLEAGASVFVGDFRIRLPNLTEAKEYPLERGSSGETLFGYWCYAEQHEPVVLSTQGNLIRQYRLSQKMLPLVGIRIVRDYPTRYP